MNRPPFRRSSTPRLALVMAALAACLSGCGPGTGGTGTGESPADLAVFGASSVNLCTAAFADQLACGALQPGTADSPVGDGTRTVVYADTSRANAVEVDLRGQTLRLRERCQGLDFVGQWGVAAPNDARFFGSYSAPGSAERVLASLTVQAVPGGDGAQLSVLLRDLAGRTVLGPLTLQRITGPLSMPTDCP
ncbi:hypothetical protein [Ideonella sp. A 288]|uniref:hypothetical protein n=1 Tax=Ideonella sp. A 288 TaxID=1962181 RepID=UPI001184E396|nr:hypothetical protein [Ideonella sp. A 288]